MLSNFFLMLCLAVLVACGGQDTAPLSPLGSWRSDEIDFLVTEGGAAMNLSCAHGVITNAISLDANGRFSMQGTYIQEHGGRLSVDEIKYSATYAGSVTSDALTLLVTKTDTGEVFGSFVLKRRGGSTSVVKCP